MHQCLRLLLLTTAAATISAEAAQAAHSPPSTGLHGVRQKQADGRWRLLVKAAGIVDVAGPRADGRLVLSTRTGLFLLRPGGAPTPFARGTGGYTAGGGEPYIALAPGSGVYGVHCSFHRDDVYALDAGSTPGVIRVSSTGAASRFVELPGAFPSGIAFDPYGRFGYRLLVTAVFGEQTTLYAIDCLGHSTVITQGGPHVEGGIAVAPKTFGRFGGDLIAADENTGRIYAFERSGGVEQVADSGLPAGGDIGVEALAFVPSRMGAGAAAYLADLGAPASPTTGNDSLLVLRGQDLAAASLQPGELLAAAEGGGTTIAVRCSTTACTVRRAAAGLATTHGEGHITILAGRGATR